MLPPLAAALAAAVLLAGCATGDDGRATDATGAGATAAACRGYVLQVEPPAAAPAARIAWDALADGPGKQALGDLLRSGDAGRRDLAWEDGGPLQAGLEQAARGAGLSSQPPWPVQRGAGPAMHVWLVSWSC